MGMNLRKTAWIFAGSFAGAAAVSYWRGRRGQEMANEVVKHGLVVGAGVSASLWALDLAGVVVPALENPAKAVRNMGNMPKQAIELLSHINPDQLYAAMRQGGVKVAPVPDDPSMISQES